MSCHLSRLVEAEAPRGQSEELVHCHDLRARPSPLTHSCSSSLLPRAPACLQRENISPLAHEVGMYVGLSLQRRFCLLIVLEALMEQLMMKDARPKSFETTPVHRPRERTAMSQFPWMLCFSLYPFCKDPLNFYQDLGPGVTELADLRIS